MLLEAFVGLRHRFPRALLRLVGRAPTGRLPDGVEAVGEVADVATELRRGGLLVLPSRQEGFGIVVAEAMAAGLPVVTTPSGGPEDIVRRSRAGLVASGHSPVAFVHAVESVVAEAGRSHELRRLGREYVEREHSPEVFHDRLHAALGDEGTWQTSPR